MNSHQRENWKLIRKNKAIFYAKYIALFYTFIIVLIMLFFFTRGVRQLTSEVANSSFLDLGGIIFLVVGWAFVGYTHGRIAWNTWEREYSGESAFATTYREIDKKATGLTNSPYKEVFALISSVIFILSPPLVIIPLILNNLEDYLPKIQFESSSYISILVFISIVILGIAAFIAVFIASALAGIILWLITLKPFYTYDEVNNLVSFSNQYNSLIMKTFNNILNKIVNVVHKLERN